MNEYQALLVAIITLFLLAIVLWDTARLGQKDESGWFDEDTFDPQ